MDAVNSLANHPTAEQVYLHVIKTHPTISKATVYRNLATAVEDNELSSPGIFNGAMLYDHKKNSHFHFVCDNCKKLFDVPGFELKENLSSLQNFTINKVELTFRGLCEDCGNLTDEKEKNNGK